MYTVGGNKIITNLTTLQIAITTIIAIGVVYLCGKFLRNRKISSNLKVFHHFFQDICEICANGDYPVMYIHAEAAALNDAFVNKIVWKGDAIIIFGDFDRLERFFYPLIIKASDNGDHVRASSLKYLCILRAAPYFKEAMQYKGLLSIAVTSHIQEHTRRVLYKSHYIKIMAELSGMTSDAIIRQSELSLL